MILEELTAQLRQRFAYEKRAHVCLWFDPRGEFWPLASALAARLAGASDPPFRVIAYDRDVNHGQLWIKRQVSSARAATACQRFVIYLPLAEEEELELLAEYRLAGVTWRIDGKQPSLHRFLRTAGVPVSGDPAEQRKLRDGGADSLLTKYTVRFADQSRRFWTDSTVTLALAQERLLGDVDQRILEIASDPTGGWNGLREDGVEAEFRDAVAARHGFASPLSAANWLRDLACQIALTEAFVAFGEPAGFPLPDRLPAAAARTHNVELLHRWLRDREARGGWDRLVAEVERDIDISAWAADQDGLAFAFPHLVKARWARARAAFVHAAARQSTSEAFFAERADQIRAESAHAKASEQPIGAWQLLETLQVLLTAVDQSKAAAAAATDVDTLADVYVGNAHQVDASHLRVRAGAESHELPEAARVADRIYAGYTNELNSRFFDRLAAGETIDLAGIPYVRDHLDTTVWRATGRRAVVIVDALRYDCAEEVRLALGGVTEIQALRAALPTITPVGMTALLPKAIGEPSLEVSGTSVRLLISGRDMAVRANRIKALAESGADCRDIEDLERVSQKPSDLGELLVVFGHDDVDQLGHSDSAALVRHFEVEVRRLARLVQRLHRWGYPDVHLVTDHGFILLDEQHLPEVVPCDRAWCKLLKQRFALVPAGIELPLTTFALPWSADLRVAVPPGLAFFRAEGSFSHGGAALQELLTPYVISRSAPAERPVDLEVRVASTNLVQTVVRVALQPAAPGQLSFSGRGRRLLVDVLRDGRSVLASGSQELHLEPQSEEIKASLFFRSAESFTAGETLTLDVRDADTGERFPPAGLALTVGRDM
jgi:hypothetical protein